jgi:hypothetical protein
MNITHRYFAIIVLRALSSLINNIDLVPTIHRHRKSIKKSLLNKKVKPRSTVGIGAGAPALLTEVTSFTSNMKDLKSVSNNNLDVIATDNL